MKKLILSAITIAAFVGSSKAQITLNQSGYPASLIGNDTLKQTLSVSTYPNLSPATNATWDLTSMLYGSSLFFDYRVASSTAQFADSTTYNFGGFGYDANIQKSMTATGFVRYGQQIKRTGYSLAAVTSGPNDSIIIDNQNFNYSVPDTILKFPCTYNTKWKTNFVYDFHFHISVALFFLTNAPGYVRTYETTIDTVTGWGKMKVNDINGTPTGFMDVLQIKSYTYLTDSFYVNGSPANVLLLTAMGLTQGQKDTIVEQYYYRAGEVTPLAYVQYDTTFTNIKSVETHATRLATNGVGSVIKDKMVHIYPNPAVGREIHVDFAHKSEDMTYDVVDVTGKIVSSGTLSAAANIISLPSSGIGIHFIRVFANGQLYVARSFQVN